MLSDDNVQRYAKALYSVALLLILVPLVDLALRTFPPQFGTLQWRFATVGMLLGSLGTVLLGLGLFGLVAALTGQRAVLRGAGFVALGLGVMLLAILVLFGLDAIQIRRLANANFKRAILVSSMGALFTGTMGLITLLAVGRGAMTASRRPTTPARRVKPAASPIVVAARPGATESV